MKKKLKQVLKNFSFFYYVYNVMGSAFVKILKVIVKTDDKLILFSSYGGKKYDDSPRSIYEYMKGNNKYSDFKFIWAFENKKSFTSLSESEKVEIDTIKYYITALKAGYWVTNSSMTRGLNFKGKDTCYLNTWHGTPIKKMGTDISSNSKSFKTISDLKKKKSEIDIMLAQSRYEVNIFSRVFNIPKERFLISGLPRNDKLVDVTEFDKGKAREKLGISSEKKVILYAPTFREYQKANGIYNTLAPPIDLKKWREKLGDNYLVLFRAHYEVVKVLGLDEDNDFVINVSNYHSLDELMVASDILISDYSSIMFDFSLLKRPILCFAYDFDEYSLKRGLYLDLKKELPGSLLESEDEVLNAILSINIGVAVRETENFSKKYIEVRGNAAERATTGMIGY